jgi:hypothetical protein
MQAPDAKTLRNSWDWAPVRACGAQALKRCVDRLNEALAKSTALPLIPTCRLIEIRFRFRRQADTPLSSHGTSAEGVHEPSPSRSAPIRRTARVGLCAQSPRPKPSLHRLDPLHARHLRSARPPGERVLQQEGGAPLPAICALCRPRLENKASPAARRAVHSPSTYTYRMVWGAQLEPCAWNFC